MTAFAMDRAMWRRLNLSQLFQKTINLFIQLLCDSRETKPYHLHRQPAWTGAEIQIEMQTA